MGKKCRLFIGKFCGIKTVMITYFSNVDGLCCLRILWNKIQYTAFVGSLWGVWFLVVMYSYFILFRLKILLRFSKTRELWGSKANWCLLFSLPSIILVDLLGNRSLFQRVQKVMVCDLWLVDFNPFCAFLCFKVRCWRSWLCCYCAVIFHSC